MTVINYIPGLSMSPSQNPLYERRLILLQFTKVMRIYFKKQWWGSELQARSFGATKTKAFTLKWREGWLRLLAILLESLLRITRPCRFVCYLVSNIFFLLARTSRMLGHDSKASASAIENGTPKINEATKYFQSSQYSHCSHWSHIAPTWLKKGQFTSMKILNFSP